MYRVLFIISEKNKLESGRVRGFHSYFYHLLILLWSLFGSLLLFFCMQIHIFAKKKKNLKRMCLCPQAVCQYDLMSLNNNIVKWQNVFGARKSLIVWIKALIKGTLSCHFIGVSYIIDAIFKSSSSVSSLYFPELRMKYGYTVVSALNLDTLHVYFFPKR